MITQYDSKVRVVSLANLEAMCKHVSGVMCHKFKVEKVTRSRVHVSYSNENEYATPNPVIAIYPCYPQYRTTCVVLSAIRVINDPYDDVYCLSFLMLEDCPTMRRNSTTGNWEPDNA